MGVCQCFAERKKDRERERKEEGQRAGLWRTYQTTQPPVFMSQVEVLLGS